MNCKGQNKDTYKSELKFHDPINVVVPSKGLRLKLYSSDAALIGKRDNLLISGLPVRYFSRKESSKYIN